MPTEEFKEKLREAKERIVAENEQTRRFLADIGDSLPLPQPLPKGQKGKILPYKLQSPLHPSPRLFDALTAADLPVPISKAEKNILGPRKD